MTRYLKITAAILSIALLSACGGSGGSSSSPTAPAPNFGDTVTPPGQYTPGINKVSGDSQTGLVWGALSENFVVSVYDSTGNPSKGAVTFTVTGGSATLNSSNQVVAYPNSQGIAYARLTFKGDVETVTVKASSSMGSVTFTATPRLPTLAEVIDATVDGDPVSQFPAILVMLDNGKNVLGLLKGTDPATDTGGLPLAGDLVGGQILGIPAVDYQVIFLPIGSLTGLPDTNFNPTGSLLLSRYIKPDLADGLPVVKNLLINGDPALVGIVGSFDPQSITVDGTLGDLYGTPAADLPIYLVPASAFPADPAADDFSYAAMGLLSAPAFIYKDDVSGTSSADWIMQSSAVVPTISPSIVKLTGGIAANGSLLTGVPPLVDLAAPVSTLTPLPVEFLNVFNIVENEIAPSIENSQPTMQSLQTTLQEMGNLLLENADLLASLNQLDFSDLSSIIFNPDLGDLLAFTQDMLPLVDDLANDALTLLDTMEYQLNIVRDELLPQIVAALPADGVTFGTDGDPSSIAGDVIPFIEDQLALLLDHIDPNDPSSISGMDAIRNLLQDIANLPDSIWNIGGMMTGIGNIMDDLPVVMDFMAANLQLLDDKGIDIINDMLDQAAADFPEGTLVSDTTAFQGLLASMEAALPPDATLGDVFDFSFLDQIPGGFLPPEMGDIASTPIFDLISNIGSLDIGADIIPAMQNGVDGLDAALPGIIDQLSNFSLGSFWP